MVSKQTHYVLSLLISASVVTYFETQLFISCIAILAALSVAHCVEEYLVCRWAHGHDPLWKIISALVLQLVAISFFYLSFVSGVALNFENMLPHEVAEMKAFGLSIILSFFLSILMYLSFNAYRWEREPYIRRFS